MGFLCYFVGHELDKIANASIWIKLRTHFLDVDRKTGNELLQNDIHAAYNLADDVQRVFRNQRRLVQIYQNVTESCLSISRIVKCKGQCIHTDKANVRRVDNEQLAIAVVHKTINQKTMAVFTAILSDGIQQFP